MPDDMFHMPDLQIDDLKFHVSDRARKCTSPKYRACIILILRGLSGYSIVLINIDGQS